MATFMAMGATRAAVAWFEMASVSSPVISSWALPLALATGITVLVLFTVPITLLGCLSPFAIRLTLLNVGAAGKTAGRLYAISTLGSVIGSLTPVLFFLPAVGTSATFLLFAYILLVVALFGLARQDLNRFLWLSWMPLLHLILWTQI